MGAKAHVTSRSFIRSHPPEPLTFAYYTPLGWVWMSARFSRRCAAGGGTIDPRRLGNFIMKKRPRIAVCGLFGGRSCGGVWQGPPPGKMGPGRLGIFMMKRWPRIAVCGLFGPIVWGGAWQGPPVGKVSPKEAGIFYHEKVA